MANDYKDTLFLPKTDFPMRANLSQREPEFLKFWYDIDVYGRLRRAEEKEQGQALFHPSRRAALREREHPYRNRDEQDSQGLHS